MGDNLILVMLASTLKLPDGESKLLKMGLVLYFDKFMKVPHTNFDGYMVYYA